MHPIYASNVEVRICVTLHCFSASNANVCTFFTYGEGEIIELRCLVRCEGYILFHFSYSANIMYTYANHVLVICSPKV